MTWSQRTTYSLGATVLLLLGAGTAHRWAHHARATEVAGYIAPGAPLASLPLRIEAFTRSRDIPLSDEVLRVADVDDFIYREYFASSTGETIQLYVGYWGRENVGMGHGPEVCFPSAGWEIHENPRESLVPFRDTDECGANAKMAIHHFSRTDPEGVGRMAVGFIAVMDGEFRASSRGMLLHRPPRRADRGFLAHIEVSTLVAEPGGWSAADARIVAFMQEILPHISKCLFPSRWEADRDGKSEVDGATG